MELVQVAYANILIAITKAHAGVRLHLEQHADHEILLSSVVLAESQRDHNRLVFAELSKAFKLPMRWRSDRFLTFCAVR